MHILGMVHSQTQLLDEEVVLIKELSQCMTQRTKQSNLIAIIFVRPTEENVKMIRHLLTESHYQEVKLCIASP